MDTVELQWLEWKLVLAAISYLSEVGATKTWGLLSLGKKHLDHQNWESLMQSKKTGPPF